jgi:hypothetical protein
MFRKLDLFPSSGKRGEKTPTQLGPLERANLNLHCPEPFIHKLNRTAMFKIFLKFIMNIKRLRAKIIRRVTFMLIFVS